MPTTYKPRPPVNCFNCGDEMIKRRTSKSGRYYCPKTACQAERRADWLKDRGDSRVRAAEDKLAESIANTAAFIKAARDGDATCPDCGLTNAPQGWAHFNREGAGCGGLGIWAGSVHISIADAVLDPERRIYVEVKK